MPGGSSDSNQLQELQVGQVQEGRHGGCQGGPG